jgi:hypothetical protein
MSPYVDAFLAFITNGFSFLDFSGFDSKNPELAPIDCFIGRTEYGFLIQEKVGWI